LDALELLRAHALVDATLERELGVQVLTEERVLDLARLTEQVDELFAAVDLQLGLDCSAVRLRHRPSLRSLAA